MDNCHPSTLWLRSDVENVHHRLVTDGRYCAARTATGAGPQRTFAQCVVSMGCRELLCRRQRARRNCADDSVY